MKRSAFLRSLLLGAAVAAVGASHAQVWPDKPITLIVPFPAGIVDGNARLIAAKASAMLGQPIVVKNMPGAGQRIGCTCWRSRR